MGREERYKFHIFAKKSGLVELFAREDSRIILRDFIPREKLLEELAAMDFLVNFENAGSRQMPSKLIDYWLCQRPILSLNSHAVPEEVIERFFKKDYQDAPTIDRPERYDIVNIVKAFDQLAEQSLAAKLRRLERA